MHQNQKKMFQLFHKTLSHPIEKTCSGMQKQTKFTRTYSDFFPTTKKTGWKNQKADSLSLTGLGTLRYWAERDGKFEKKKESIPECENAAAYRSLIYNIDEYDYEW